MLRSLFMTLIALLTAACVQVGAAPSGSPVTPSAPAATSPPVSTSATTVPGAPGPIRTKRPRPQRPDASTQPPTAPPTEPPTAPPTEPPTAPPTEPPTEAGLPDLYISSIPVYEDAGVVKLEFDVRNTGPGDAGRFVVAVGCPGRIVTQVVDGLAAGSRTRVRFSLDSPRMGLALPGLDVDAENEVAESDEDNNFSFLEEPVLCGG